MAAEDTQLIYKPNEELIKLTRDKVAVYSPDSLNRWLFVDVYAQVLFLVRDNTATDCWPVSTASVGLDNRQDSGGTPAGIHKIEQKIGQHETEGTVFSSRKPTGEIVELGSEASTLPEDLILTRIITLAGLEDGLNLGPGIDSLERYIYIHGTNNEQGIGQPLSCGCIRMKNVDIIDLFDLVAEGDPVVIV